MLQRCALMHLVHVKALSVLDGAGTSSPFYIGPRDAEGRRRGPPEQKGWTLDHDRLLIQGVSKLGFGRRAAPWVP